ncbi:MAG TPA: hypothetical protein VJ972_06855 [Anaerolineales bacterium]|nr:hypothetical protein [Anaerolineales bacterium]
MTVRVGKVTFFDWVSLPFRSKWTDTFIFRIDAHNGLPPFAFRSMLQRMCAYMCTKRSIASLWIQVDSPGDWYLAEVKRSMLPGLGLPYAVTHIGDVPQFESFSFQPPLLHEAPPHPPTMMEEEQKISPDELKCLQVLGRIVKGNVQDIASLTGLSEDVVTELLAGLDNRKLVIHKIGSKITGDKSKPVEMDSVPLWHLKRKGLKIALRSWGVPKGIEFTSRTEENLHLIDTDHRHISRRWLAWLKAAWPQAEIWAGWSEVRLPETSVLPDALAWGRIQGYETLFWLEVGDEHKNREEIEEITRKRLDEAWKFCQETGARLVYTQLSVNWVHKAARWALNKIPQEAAVVLGNRRKFGVLPTVEWNVVTSV